MLKNLNEKEMKVMIDLTLKYSKIADLTNIDTATKWLKSELNINDDFILRGHLMTISKINDLLSNNLKKIKTTFKNLMRKGLDTGKVESEEILNINFDEEEDIKDYYEAVEELQSRDIKIMNYGEELYKN